MSDFFFFFDISSLFSFLFLFLVGYQPQYEGAYTQPGYPQYGGNYGHSYAAPPPQSVSAPMHDPYADKAVYFSFFLFLLCYFFLLFNLFSFSKKKKIHK